MTKKLDQAKKIIEKLSNHNYEAVIVGGAVRDLLMGKEPTDFDIATDAPPDEVEKLFKKTIGVGKKFGVILVVFGKNQFEVATFRKDFEYKDGRRPEKVEFSNAKEDVLRRDFTINGLFMHPKNNSIIDFVGGEKDIKKKLVRCIGDPQKRFGEDHLRILRAIRFASNLHFNIEQQTWDALCLQKELLKKVSIERIRDEFEKIITRPNSIKGIELIYEGNLNSQLFGKDFFPNKPNFHPILKEMLSHSNLISLEKALSCLYISSPCFLEYGEDHNSILINKNWMKNLNNLILHLKRFTFSNKTIVSVKETLATVLKLFSNEEIKVSTLRRALGNLHGSIIYDIVCKIDLYYSNTLKLKEKLEEIKNVYENKNLLPDPLIKGKELLELNLNSGPSFSRLLNKMYEIQLNDDKLNKSDLLNILKKELNN